MERESRRELYVDCYATKRELYEGSYSRSYGEGALQRQEDSTCGYAMRAILIGRIELYKGRCSRKSAMLWKSELSRLCYAIYFYKRVVNLRLCYATYLDRKTRTILVREGLGNDLMKIL